MICGFCQREFDANQAQKACRDCPLRRCGLVKCPYCGYEMPPEPKWLERLRNRRRVKRGG